MKLSSDVQMLQNLALVMNGEHEYIVREYLYMLVIVLAPQFLRDILTEEEHFLNSNTGS